MPIQQEVKQYTTALIMELTGIQCQRTLTMRQLSQQVCTTPNQVLHYKFVLQHVKPFQVPMYVLQQRVLI